MGHRSQRSGGKRGMQGRSPAGNSKKEVRTTKKHRWRAPSTTLNIERSITEGKNWESFLSDGFKLTGEGLPARTGEEVLPKSWTRARQAVLRERLRLSVRSKTLKTKKGWDLQKVSAISTPGPKESA